MALALRTAPLASAAEREANRHGSRAVEIDALRFLATLGVIWVHVAEYQGHGPAVTGYGRFGTAYYTAAAVLIALHGAGRTDSRLSWTVVSRRARRLLTPFLGWSLVYGMFHARHSLGKGTTWSEVCRWWGPLAGTAPHLWFLPFAFAVSLLTIAAGPTLLRMPRSRLVIGVAALVPLSYWMTYAYLRPSLDHPWLLRWHLHRLDRWVEEAPFVVLCLALGTFWFRGEAKRLASWRRPARVLAGACALLFIAVEVGFAAWGDELRRLTQSEGRQAAQVAGLLLLGLALSLGDRLRLVRITAPLGRHTYAIFLGHFLVIELANDYWWRLPGFGRPSFAALSTVAVFVVCLALSALRPWGVRVVEGLTRSRGARGAAASA